MQNLPRRTFLGTIAAALTVLANPARLWAAKPTPVDPFVGFEWPWNADVWLRATVDRFCHIRAIRAICTINKYPFLGQTAESVFCLGCNAIWQADGRVQLIAQFRLYEPKVLIYNNSGGQLVSQIIEVYESVDHGDAFKQFEIATQPRFETDMQSSFYGLPV